MSKIGSILDKKVSVEFSVSELVMIQAALARFDVSVLGKSVIQENFTELHGILGSLETVLEKEFPIS